MIERKSKIKLFLIKTFLLKAVYGSLCVYNSQGTVKFDDLSLKDIEYAYSQLEYFIGNNPFNAYFGDCVNDQELVNIFGIQAKKSHHAKDKRENHKSFLDTFDLENGKVCNLLVGQEADSNPYSKELTGLVNPNLLEGWKAIGLTDVTLAGGGSMSISKVYSFDDTYSVSLKESSFENDSYILENDDSTNENNFCSIISQIMKESLVNTMIDEGDGHLENSVMNNISRTNEEYSEDYWCRKDSSSYKANISDESKGTSEEYIAGNYENNGSSRIKSESVSISESMLKSNLNVQSIKNAIERSTSYSQSYDGYRKENGRKCASRSSELDNLSYTSRFIEVDYDFNFDTVKGGDENCQVELFKKITKIVNVVSCHDLDDEKKNSKNSKSLEVTDVDFELLEKILKVRSKRRLKVTHKESSGSFVPLALRCSNHNEEKISFIPEDNEFIQVKRMTEENDGINKFYHILPSYLELSSRWDEGRIKTIKNIEDDNIANVLTNANGDIIFKKENKEIFNTLTGTVSRNAVLRISDKNHLEVYVKDEDMFGPVGYYASEFEGVNYAVNPGKNDTLNKVEDDNEEKNVSETRNEKRSTNNNLLDKSNFNVPEVVVWSSVRPEHQHLTVGWSGNEDGNEVSYLVINTHNYNDSMSYDGMTLYDPNGIPIWKLDFDHPKENNSYLDSNGYYLPFKYGYPFKNEAITKNIPEKYAEKKYSYLTIPDNVTYKGNTLFFGGCDHHLISEHGRLEGLISENGRFRLILKDDGNLVFKDHHVTIWESKTSHLWQGKAPYKLIVGDDGIMRILNSLEDVIMSTINKEIKPHKGPSNYRLEVLNAGTFRIVNEKGEEVWNMWNHADHHEFNIYLEKVTYPACQSQVRNKNLPFLSTANEADAIIRVGEQLINRFTEKEYRKLLLDTKYNNRFFIDDSFDDFNSTLQYKLDQDNQYYYTASLELLSNNLKYQNKLVIDNEVEEFGYSKSNHTELIPQTGRKLAISYGKLNKNGEFIIYDSKDHILFSTEIQDEICKKSKDCFYYMFITPYYEGFVNIMKRKYHGEKYTDTLIWQYPSYRHLTEMRSDREDHFLNNYGSLIYRNEDSKKNDTILNKVILIDEFPCVTLRPDGVYFLDYPEPYYRYKIKGNSTLYLDRNNGYLSLDGRDVLGLEDRFLKLPTKLQCDIIDDKIGIRLVDYNDNTIWQYPDNMNFQLTNKKLNNTMIVGDSLYYYNEKCLEVQSNALVSHNNTSIVEFPSVSKDSVLSMNETQVSIIDVKTNVTIPVIKYDNPEGHYVVLTCRAKDEIVITDETIHDILWRYPTPKPLLEYNDDKKYEISSHDVLNYGELLHIEGFNGRKEETVCLLFDHERLYTNYNNYTIRSFESNNSIVKHLVEHSYISINENRLVMNDKITIYNITNATGDDKVVGKCMNYHGHNRFVLYNPERNVILDEFPPLQKKAILKGNDTIYDNLYVDDNFSEPCIRVQYKDSENKLVGLFFHNETNSILNLPSILSIPNNNTLQFDQDKGLLLLNNHSVFNETFNSTQLQMQCKKKKGKLYVVVEDEETGKEFWKYPSIENKNSVSSLNGDKWFMDEYLFDEQFEKFVKLTEHGILSYNLTENDVITYEFYLKKISEENDPQYLYWEQKEGMFLLNLYKDNGNSVTLIEVKNKFNTQYVQLKYNEEYGCYVEDEFGHILKKFNPTLSDDDHPQSTVITKYSTSTSTKYSTLYTTKTKSSVVTKTKRSYETYTYVTYLGTIGSKYILGVNDLKEYKTIKASYGGRLNANESKYTKWLVKSLKDTPSKMILAKEDGTLSDYCLNLGEATGDSYYLTISKCSKAKYLFKYYNVPFTDKNGLKVTKSPIIGIYKNANTLFTNSKGIPFCVYYSDTLYVKECKYTGDYPNYKWATVYGRDKTYIHTMTTTTTETKTSYITASTVRSSVVTTIIPTVITTEIPLTTTKYTPSNTSIAKPTTNVIKTTTTTTKNKTSKTSTVKPTNNNN